MRRPGTRGQEPKLKPLRCSVPRHQPACSSRISPRTRPYHGRRPVALTWITYRGSCSGARERATREQCTERSQFFRNPASWRTRGKAASPTEPGSGPASGESDAPGDGSRVTERLWLGATAAGGTLAAGNVPRPLRPLPPRFGPEPRRPLS